MSFAECHPLSLPFQHYFLSIIKAEKPPKILFKKSVQNWGSYSQFCREVCRLCLFTVPADLQYGEYADQTCVHATDAQQGSLSLTLERLKILAIKWKIFKGEDSGRAGGKPRGWHVNRVDKLSICTVACLAASDCCALPQYWTSINCHFFKNMGK